MNRAVELIEQGERLQWVDPAHPTECERDELYRKRAEYLTKCVCGIDLNPDLVRAAKMNMVMNNDGSGGLFQANSLANPHTWGPAAAQAVPLGSFDVVCTNPPFGANIVIDDEDVLSQYELGAMWDQAPNGRWNKRVDAGKAVLQRSQPPEILFIERCVPAPVPRHRPDGDGDPQRHPQQPGAWLHPTVDASQHADPRLRGHGPRPLPAQERHADLDGPAAPPRRRREGARQDRRAGLPVLHGRPEKIGHVKRGNPIYRRNEQGEDVVVVRKEAADERDPVTRAETEVKDLLIDDELPEVAEAHIHRLTANR